MEVHTMKLPAITLRGLTALPRQIIDLEVGRDESIRALQAAQKADHRLFLVTQRGADKEAPSAEDVHETGVVGEIVFYEPRRHANAVHVKVDTSFPAKLHELYTDESQILTAVITPQEEKGCADGPDAVRMRRAMRELATTYAELTKKIKPDALSAIRHAATLNEVMELSASVVDMNQELRQQILDTDDRQIRYDLICLAMEGGIEDAELLIKLRDEVRRRVDKSQRDYLLREQMKVIQEELGEEGPAAQADEYEQRLKKLSCSQDVREKIAKQIHRLRAISVGSAELNVISHYIETLLDMPWDTVGEEHLDLKACEQILDQDHYGLRQVKDRVLEYLAVRKLTGGGSGQILCLVGPPGTGKTSVARSVAKAMGRRYERIGLGGVHDEAEIRGHRRTYIGAMPGRIADALRRSGVKNPLILLDEVDKINASYNGDPSAALLEALDAEQNSRFMDHYIDIPIDLSQVLFIATANDLSAIPGPLRDRLEIVEVDSYSDNEKYHIAREHLIPKQREKNGLKKNQITFSNKAIQEIISGWTSESGVRQLERCIGRICRKSAKILLEGGTEKTKDKVKVKAADLPALLGRRQRDPFMKNKTDQIGVVRGLAWTSAGGVTLEVEADILPGRGEIRLTGQLGDVMKESAAAAMSFVRAEAVRRNLADVDFLTKDIHIHIPAGAVPKDGPSAGITMACAIWSVLTQTPVRADTAMTGEITLRGRVLPIGGLKEKLLAANKAGMQQVLIPADNRVDAEGLSGEITGTMKLVYVQSMEEVLRYALSSGVSGTGKAPGTDTADKKGGVK